MTTFSITPNKKISVLLPTRGRAEVAFNSIKSMIDLADDASELEFLIAIDDDDESSATYFQEIMMPWFEDRDLDLKVFQMPRHGYLQLHKYNNFLGTQSSGQWVVFWNDDAVMQTAGWDTEICKHTGKFKVLAFETHNLHPYSIFPILPRDWLILFEKLSAHQQTDAWVSQIAYLADCFERIPVAVLHDRADLTGNNNDETYNSREYREGNTDDPMDINHIEFHNLKMHWTVKIVWLRKLLGQDTGWWDKVSAGEVDPWEKMIANDPNTQIAVTKVYKQNKEQSQ